MFFDRFKEKNILQILFYNMSKLLQEQIHTQL